MRILAVSHVFPNRINPTHGVFVKERLKALSSVVSVKIVSPLPSFPFMSFTDKYRQTKKLKSLECFDELFVSHPRFILFPKYLKFLDGFLYYLSTDNFFSKILIHNDILDFHWVYPDAYAGIKWARRFNKKIVVTIRGNESICYDESSLRKKMVIKTLRAVDHVIAVSNDLKNKVVCEYNVPFDKVTVISNGVNKDKFYLVDKVKSRSLCDLDLNKKYVISICRLSKEKGLEFLLEAFSVINDKDVNLVICGDGPLKEKLVNLSINLKIMDRVKFIGTISHDDAIYWYNSADVFCLPSLWEGCPNVILESLACGTPVVATLVGGIPDMVPSEEYGFLINPCDSNLLCKTLQRALKNEWDNILISDYGSSRTWESVACDIVKLFHILLRKDC